MPTLALAYIDPGSGMVVFQLIAAGFIGVFLFFHKAIGRFLSLFRRGRPPGAPPDPKP